MIIQFLGGIHEIYFPYVLMKPRLILAMIAGGAAGVGTFMVTGAGLVATPSPGSIFAYIAVTPQGRLVRRPRSASSIAAAVSFAVALAAARLRPRRAGDERRRRPDARGRPSATRPSWRRPGADRRRTRPSSTPATGNRDAHPGRPDAWPPSTASDIKKLVVACDAGMGSSVMLASQLRKQLQEAQRDRRAHPGQLDPGRRRRGGLPRRLAARARVSAPGQGDRAVPAVPRRPGGDQAGQGRSRTAATSVADGAARPRRAIRLDASAPPAGTTRSASCGEALVEVGAVEPAYVDAMLDREQSVSTYVGEGVAIPHGTLDGKERGAPRRARRLRFPDGVDWDGDRVTVCVGIAAKGDGHVDAARRARRDPARPGQGRGAARGRPTSTRCSELLRSRPEREPAVKVARFHAPGDVRIEDAPEPVAGPGRRQDPGPQLLDLRHRRQDLQVRPPPHRPAAGDGPRDRRRGRRGRRGRRPAGRRATGCR